MHQAWDGFVGLNISARLEDMAQQLLGWSRVSFANLGEQIVCVDRALGLAQQQPISDDSCKECSELKKWLDDLHEKQEAYWYLHTRVSEVKDGDKNTNYFHHKASERRKQNYVATLFDALGIWCLEEDDIEKISKLILAPVHFRNLNP